MSCIDKNDLNSSQSSIDSEVTGKRKRTTTDLPQEDVPWTTARCNRHLRTITSRIAIIRKLSQTASDGALENGKRGTGLNRPWDSRVCVSAKAPLSVDSPTRDPLWLPTRRPGSLKRTYGGRARSSHTMRECKPASKLGSASTERLHFPTPFLRRTFSGLQDGASATTPEPGTITSVSYSKPAASTRRRLKLPVKSTGTLEQTLRSLGSAFESMLLATQPRAKRSRTGARSLMSACLRKVPEYVALECTWREQSGEIETDAVADEVYRDLEEAGSGPQSGCDALREVVRFHAIHEICRCINEGLIPYQTWHQLVQACCTQEALLEAQQILKSWRELICASLASRLSQMHGRRLFLSALDDLNGKTDASTMYFRELSWLLQTCELQATELLGVFLSGKYRLIGAMASGSGVFEAAAFLYEAVQSCCNKSAAYLRTEHAGQSLESVVPSLMTLLTAMALSKGRENNHCSDTSLADLMLRLCTSLMLHANASEDQARKPELPFGGTLHASQLLLRASISNSDNAVVVPDTDCLLQLLELHESRSPSVRSACRFENAAHFICDVALCAGRGSGKGASSMMQVVLQDLLSLASDAKGRPKERLTTLVMEAVRLHVAHSQDEGQNSFTDQIERAVRQGTLSKFEISSTETPSGKVRQAGLRWEDDICDWIAATPFTVAYESSILPHAKLESETNPQPVMDQGQSVPSADVPFLSGTGLVVAATPLHEFCDRETGVTQPSPDVLALSSPTAPLALGVPNLVNSRKLRNNITGQLRDCTPRDQALQRPKHRRMKVRVLDKENTAPRKFSLAALQDAYQQHRPAHNGCGRSRTRTGSFSPANRVQGGTINHSRRILSDFAQPSQAEGSEDELG